VVFTLLSNCLKWEAANNLKKPMEQSIIKITNTMLIKCAWNFDLPQNNSNTAVARPEND